ncbi:MAG TPA: hypothetical protein VL400_07955 [Polyangiaceae bacterium]|nr:hypothetical protein [Polyangiaceae bacterium]
MSKVIVERPRFRRPKPGGSHYPRGHLKAVFERDLDAAPQKLGMSFPHKEKSLNENLAPLRRWLRAQVGRPWWSVKSELRSVIDARSATQLHILQHVADFVVEDVVMIDGAPHRIRWAGLERLRGRNGLPLWVAPRTGILREPPRGDRVKARFGKAIRFGPRTELRLVDGAWRAIELSPMPKDAAARSAAFDVLLGDQLAPRYFDPYVPKYRSLFGRDDAYAILVREPGRRERAKIDETALGKKRRDARRAR